MSRPVGPKVVAARALGAAVAACVWLAPGLGNAFVCDKYCQRKECAFDLDVGLQCAELPANATLSLSLVCSEQIGEEALPQLILADGTALESTWEKRSKPWLPVNRWLDPPDPREVSIFTRSGPELPVDAEVRVVSRVPQRCSVITEEGSCAANDVQCDEGAASDCCAAFSSAGLAFELTNGGQGGTEGSAGAAGTGPDATAYEFLRFRTTMPDSEPPPAPALALSCTRFTLGGGAEYVSVATALAPGAELADVSEIEVWARQVGSSEDILAGAYLAPSCFGRESRTFQLTVTFDTPLFASYFGQTLDAFEGQWEFWSRAIDASGNTSDGPVFELDYPADCPTGSSAYGARQFDSQCAPVGQGGAGGESWCSALDSEAGSIGGGPDPNEQCGNDFVPSWAGESGISLGAGGTFPSSGLGGGGLGGSGGNGHTGGSGGSRTSDCACRAGTSDGSLAAAVALGAAALALRNQRRRGRR